MTTPEEFIETDGKVPVSYFTVSPHWSLWACDQAAGKHKNVTTIAKTFLMIPSLSAVDRLKYK
jgi:hypothetical protein